MSMLPTTIRTTNAIPPIGAQRSVLLSTDVPVAAVDAVGTVCRLVYMNPSWDLIRMTTRFRPKPLRRARQPDWLAVTGRHRPGCHRTLAALTFVRVCVGGAAATRPPQRICGAG